MRSAFAQFRLETELGEHGDHLTDGLVSGAPSERARRLPVTPGERATSLLGQPGGDSAAGGEVTGENVGEQLKALWMAVGAVCSRGVDEPGPPRGTGGVGATTRESSIDEHFEVETHRVGVQGGAHGDLCHVQRGTATA